MRPVWVLLGDSLTQRSFEPSGWGASLVNAYSRSIDVQCRGFSGYNSRWVLGLLPTILPLDKPGPPPQLLILCLGANDACLPNRSSAKQHVPLEEFKANLAAIVQHARRLGVANILVLTPGPVHEPTRLTHALQTRGLALESAERTAAASGAYAAAAAEVARSLSLPSINLWTGFSQRPGWETELLCDGLHFSSAGQTLVGDWVREAIAAHFPTLTPQALPWEGPDHTDIDGERWEACLASGGGKHP
ncbi:hypothetical protein ACKKBF_B00315 [Auxenochlorella protothecoides x Auxenochlorella symbiontica]